MEYPKFKVTVSCMTYNQSKYITDAMNGFTMQQTSFPYVCTIVDDASTDGEQDVIRKYVEENFDFSEGSVAYHKETDYAHIAYARHKTNKNCYFAVLYLKENHYSQRKPKVGYLSEWRDMCEYEALCEGDDYWIDPLKLQKQVSFLDSRPDFTLVAGCCSSLIQSDGKIYKSSDCVEKEITFESMLFTDHIATCTTMFRIKNIREYQRWNHPTWKMGDYPIWLFMSQKGRVYRFGDQFAVYRVLPNSASHTDDANKAVEFKLSSISCSLFFIEKFGLKDDLKKKFYEVSANNLMHRGLSFQSFEFIEAAINFKKEHALPVTVKDKTLFYLLKSKWCCKCLKVSWSAYTYARKNIFRNYHR